jgi:hypothetical protein
MARLYANENFPYPVVEELRRLGHDVITIQETGKAQQALPDEEVLSEAAKDQRAVLTINRKHFVKLHGSTNDHGGIIVCSFDLNFQALAKRIHDNIKAQKTLRGKLLRVNRPG